MTTLFDVIEGPLRMPAQRYGILLTGPNASGKTTLAQKAVVPFATDRRVRLIDQDNDSQKNIEQIEATLTAHWESAATVVLVVGTNRCATVVGRVLKKQPATRIFEAHITTMTADVMSAHLRARCARRGKVFRADYWDDRVLHYEGERRYARLSREWFETSSRFWPIGLSHAETCAPLEQYLRERIAACLAN